MEYEAGLMLEGGGMRCAFTVGVLDYFLDQQIVFPYVATASAGALIGSSYIAGQRERNYRLLTALGEKPEFVSIKRMLYKKELFSMDFIFENLANQTFPLEFQRFLQSNSQFIVGTTDVNSGKPIFYDSFDNQEDLSTIIRASCSLPVLASSVSYQGRQLMDGGVADPIPIKPLIERGMNKNVVILTRHKDYEKKATKFNWFFKHYFKDKPKLISLLENRHLHYNNTMQNLLSMQQQNDVYIIQPEEPLEGSRFEKNSQKLRNLYQQGYQEAKKHSESLYSFLKGTEKPSIGAVESISS